MPQGILCWQNLLCVLPETGTHHAKPYLYDKLTPNSGMLQILKSVNPQAFSSKLVRALTPSFH